MIAIVGDIHGRFKELYEEIDRLETKVNLEIDALILLGDVMPIRDENDLNNSYINERYRDLKFYSYNEFYKKGFVPRPTYFIGGNHEPYCYLGEERKELLENLVYLGRVGRFELNNLSFVFLSGIYSPKHYNNLERKDCKSREIIYFNKNDVQELEKLLDNQSILLIHEHLHLNPKDRSRGISPLDEILKKHRVKAIFAGHLHIYRKYPYNGGALIYLAKFPLENSIYLINEEQNI